MLLTSKQNELIKYAVSLKSPKNSKENNECLVESEKIVKQLLTKGVLTTIFVEESKVNLIKKELNNFNGKVYYISESISNYLTDTNSPSGIFAIAKINYEVKSAGNKILILDNLQDPSNLGSIVRSAVAFNFDTIVCVNGVYPFLPKVIRSSMGYIFDINIILLNDAQLVDFLAKNKYNLVCADMSGDDLKMFKPQLPIALIIGNEGNGVSKTLKQQSQSIVRIPMDNAVESLNASVSASIIMYKIGE